ncbi:MAG: M14 family zinc carboxypeptidase [Betaproteobacteria bacterium]
MINDSSAGPDSPDASAASIAASPTGAPRQRTRHVLLAGAVALALVLSTAFASMHRRTVSPRVAAAAPASAAVAAVAAASAASGAAAAADLGQWCGRLASQVPGVAQPACRASGLVAGAGGSVRGVPLWTHDVLPATGTPRFKVLLLGGIHGDELASVTLAFDWIARSHDAQLAAPPRAAKPSMADVAWRFVPLLNPDGLLHAPSTRVNAHGVDLNRNFPTADWERDAQPYWIKRTKKDPRRFPGTQPLSEPESRWLLQQIDQFHPDLIVSVHAPYGLLDFDGPPPAPRRLGSLQLDPVGVYPGSLGNYGGLVKNVPVMTLELKNARQVPPRELAAMWNDLQRWIDEQMVNPGVQASAQRSLVPGTRSLGAPRRAD